MPWYYAASGQQTGPLTDEQFQSLITAGTIRADTLVWREGMANWQPYGQITSPNPTATETAGTAAGVVCSECGQTFPPDQVIRIADKNVCVTCKPRLVQRLTEGAAPTGVGSGLLTEQQLLTQEYRVEIGSSIERAWKLFSSNAGMIIGATLLVGLAFAVGWGISLGISMVIPFANVLLQALYVGPLTGGMLWVLLKLARGQPATIGDAFVGFSEHFMQLFLATLVQTLILVACFLPVGVIAGIAGVGMGFMRGRGGSPTMGVGLAVLMGIAVLLAVAVIAYVSTLWTHSLLLIVDKRMKFWPAMELSRKMVSKGWGMTFLFLLVGGVISSAGFIACGVGLVVTVPLFWAMKVYFYEDNFRDLQPAA